MFLEQSDLDDASVPGASSDAHSLSDDAVISDPDSHEPKRKAKKLLLLGLFVVVAVAGIFYLRSSLTTKSPAANLPAPRIHILVKGTPPVGVAKQVPTSVVVTRNPFVPASASGSGSSTTSSSTSGVPPAG